MKQRLHSDLQDALFYYVLGAVIALPLLLWFHEGGIGPSIGFIILFSGGMGTRYLYRYAKQRSR